MATRAIFNILNARHKIIVMIMPAIMENTLFGSSHTQAIATDEPTKFDLNRSIDNLLESFSSGEMTRMMDNKAQNISNSL